MTTKKRRPGVNSRSWLSPSVVEGPKVKVSAGLAPSGAPRGVPSLLLAVVSTCLNVFHSEPINCSLMFIFKVNV